MKTVKYMDVVFEVPDEYNFIAADTSGYVYAYTHRPIKIAYDYEVSDGEIFHAGALEALVFPLMEIGDD